MQKNGLELVDVDVQNMPLVLTLDAKWSYTLLFKIMFFFS